MSYLFLVVRLLVGRVHWFGEATDRALVANESVALDHHAKKQRIVVAVGCGRDDAQSIAAGGGREGERYDFRIAGGAGVRS